MPKGGARNRSGPPKDPRSRTSERAGFTLTALPAAGYGGRPPGLNQFLPKPTARHREVWAQLWSTPQACAWSAEPWRWPIVADLVRRMVQQEDPDSPVTVATAVRQLRDDLGLSTAGLRQQGWAISHDELSERRESKETQAQEQPRPQRRLRAVGDAQS